MLQETVRLDREKRLLVLQLSSAEDQAQQQRLQWEDTRSSEKSSRDLLMSELVLSGQVLHRYPQTACMLPWSQSDWKWTKEATLVCANAWVLCQLTTKNSSRNLLFM